MKDEFLEITLKVPASAIDWSKCGDGCGEVYGAECAQLRVSSRYGTELLPINQFADSLAATRLMLWWLGEEDELTEAQRKRDEKRRTVNHYTEMARKAQEMADEIKRRKLA